MIIAPVTFNFEFTFYYKKYTKLYIKTKNYQIKKQNVNENTLKYIT